MYNYGENPDGGSFQNAGIKDKRRCEKSIYDLMFAVLNTLRNVLIYSVTVSDIIYSQTIYSILSNVPTQSSECFVWHEEADRKAS